MKIENWEIHHIPVLLEEVLEVFDPKPGQIYIDATVDGGGHAVAIARRVAPEGKVIGIDWDCDLIKELGIRNKERKAKNIELICDNYVNIRKIAEDQGVKRVDGILFDLGFSSYHVEASGRGFSFLKNEPLDMRYNPEVNDLTAEYIVNQWPQPELEEILKRYGEERFARRIAAGIARARTEKRITRVAQLGEIIVNSVPGAYRRGRLHPATRTFQALRIAVNRELENIGEGLANSWKSLGAGGVVAAISFHSLEDRLVKQFFHSRVKAGEAALLTPRPLGPSREEQNQNPRARSAKLRAIRKIATSQ